LTLDPPEPPPENPESQASPPRDPVVSGPGPSLYGIAWAFYLLLAIGAVVWIGVREETIPFALFFDPDRWYLDALLGLGAGLLMVGLWHLARWRLAAARELERALAPLLRGLRREETLALAFLSGFAEELFFRGAMQGSLGVVVTTLLFALLHRGPGRAFRIWPLFALLAGALFGALMLWRGNLLAPTVAHVAVNAVGLRRLGPGSHRR
jgi:membrane protease YdiL (CAAX protease family)